MTLTHKKRGQRQIKDGGPPPGWGGYTKYKGERKRAKRGARSSILVQVGFSLDILSVPVGVCCCYSRQHAPFPLSPSKTHFYTSDKQEGRLRSATPLTPLLFAFKWLNTFTCTRTMMPSASYLHDSASCNINTDGHTYGNNFRSMPVW